MTELKPCPFCGGEIDERGGQCNYGKRIMTLTKYITRDALVEWLKRVPLKDLSDGLGLCRIIMEDDFKKAIKKMPKGIIVDAVPVSELEELRDYLYAEDLIFMRGLAKLNKLIAKHGGTKAGKAPNKNTKP